MERPDVDFGAAVEQSELIVDRNAIATGDGVDGFRLARELTVQETALTLLRRLYAAVQLRAASGGYQVGKCLACNVPHPRGRCVHNCACHEVAPYLVGLSEK